MASLLKRKKNKSPPLIPARSDAMEMVKDRQQLLPFYFNFIGRDFFNFRLTTGTRNSSARIHRVEANLKKQTKLATNAEYRI